MPKHWYCKGSEDEYGIAADRKPYFMKYIYPETMRRTKTYDDNANRKCLMEFKLTISELIQKPNKTKAERTFLQYYIHRMPVSVQRGLINRICWKIESIFDNKKESQKNSVAFDPSVYKTKKPYAERDFVAIRRAHEEYVSALKRCAKLAGVENWAQDKTSDRYALLRSNFKDMCQMTCMDDEDLCNILIDLCYQKASCRQSAWDVCADQMIQNLLSKVGGKLCYPQRTASDDYDLMFGGNRFKMKEVTLHRDYT